MRYGCLGGDALVRPIGRHICGMKYRIVPARGTYRVEAIDPHGVVQVLGSWPTEEAAVTHLRDLVARAEVADRQCQPFGKDWRGLMTKPPKRPRDPKDGGG